MHSYLCRQDLFCTSSVRTVGPVTHLSHDKGRYLATGKPCAFYLFKHSNGANSLSWVEQTERHKAAVLSLNESFSSLRALLCNWVFFFVVPWAFDKASCSSSAKSRTSPLGPQVGGGSPAALCTHFIVCKHTQSLRGRRAHAQWELIFPYIVMQAQSFKVNGGYCSGVFAVYIKVVLSIQAGTKKKLHSSQSFFIHKWQQSGVSSREGGGAICCHIAPLLCLWAC